MVHSVLSPVVTPFDAAVEEINKATDGTAEVRVSGQTHTTQWGQLMGGAACWIAPNSLSGTGPWTRGTDGISRTATDPRPLQSRAYLRVVNGNPIAGDGAFFEVVGISDFEAAMLGFVWDKDDAGDFEHLHANFPNGRSKAEWHGFATTHAWTTPGTKTVTVTITRVLDDGTAESFTLSTSVVVRDPDTEFANETWVVGAQGGDTPPAGTQVADFATALDAAKANGGGRILLKGGETFTTGSGHKAFSYDLDGKGYIGTWGTGKATISLADGGFNVVNDPPGVLIFRDIIFSGTYDPATGTGVGERRKAIRFPSEGRVSVVGCEFSGCETGILAWGAVVDQDARLVVFDTKISAWENYGIYTDLSTNSGFAGLVIEQDVLAVNGSEAKDLGEDLNYPDHGPIRMSRVRGLTVYGKIQFFSNNGWSAGNDAGAPAGKVALMAHQPAIRNGSTDSIGGRTSISDIYSEGGNLSLAATSSNGTEVSSLCVVSSAMLVATANKASMIQFGHTNTWIVNCVLVYPDVLSEHNSARGPFAPWGSINPLSGWLDTEVNIYNTTVVNLISDANVRNTASFDADDILGVDMQGAAFNQYNGVFYMPNATFNDEAAPRDADGPISTTTTGMPAKYVGERRANIDGSPATTDTAYATPAADLLTGKLAAGSPAIGDVAVGVTRPAFDFEGTVRTGVTSRGAYHAAG